jgi:hypothetical protein
MAVGGGEAVAEVVGVPVGVAEGVLVGSALAVAVAVDAEVMSVVGVSTRTAVVVPVAAGVTALVLRSNTAKVNVGTGVSPPNEQPARTHDIPKSNSGAAKTERRRL